ncbi:MAG TPA: type II toxin-antitoxin system VapC family toxin [Acidimicrobiales bacterium]|nr:type II toxin-antitoxin system VapC family toxin [Acidimicrobiales bacterium]
MSARGAYLDTSAFVKLIVVEPESASLRQALIGWPDRASSTLLRTETVRALRCSGNDQLIGRARRLFAGVHLIRLDEPLLDRSGDLPPAGLPALDAVHLAAALSMGPDLGAVFTYDERLSEAALAQGLRVASPS